VIYVAKTNEQLLIGCEHDGSYVPVNEVKRLMDAARADGRADLIARLIKEISKIYTRELKITCIARNQNWIMWHSGARDTTIEIIKIIKMASIPAGAKEPLPSEDLPPQRQTSGSVTAKPAGGSPHAIECPRRLSNGAVCNKMSPEVRCTKDDECVHQCPSHGHFKVKIDGSIVWLQR
jgi:hypothetical protein